MSTKPISDKSRALPQVLATLTVTFLQRLFFQLSSLDQVRHDVSLSEICPIALLFFIPLFSTWSSFPARALGGRVTVDLETHHIHRAFQ